MTAVIAALVLLLVPDAGAAKPGPNDKFLDPKLDVGAWSARFEGGDREVWKQRQAIVAALKLPRGAAVADVGAGTGLFTMLFSQEVGPAGHVYAVEIAPRFLEHLASRAKKSKATNITVVRGTTESTMLAPSSVDVVFLCDTYHHFEHPKLVLASIKRALRPRGALVLVDFKREPGKTAAWIVEHVRAGQDVVTKEIEAEGFSVPEELPLLKDNYVLRFRVRP